ncbi:MAG TPA: hypothetical protein VN796_02995 [Acidimicrobiales bacterium]|nr:hypothetical protein [Acidimicrobiales bacterium]
MSRDDRAPAVPGGPSVPAGRGPGVSAMVRRGAVAFGRFWWDFLVGETPELLVGAVVAVGGAALLVHSGAVRAVVVGALPVLVVAILALSVWRARARAQARSESQG